MKTVGYIFKAIFALIAVMCTIGGFWNPIHFFFAAMCVIMFFVVNNEIK